MARTWVWMPKYRSQECSQGGEMERRVAAVDVMSDDMVGRAYSSMLRVVVLESLFDGNDSCVRMIL